VSFVVEKDKPFGPMNISFLCPVTVMPRPDRQPHLVKQLRFRRCWNSLQIRFEVHPAIYDRERAVEGSVHVCFHIVTLLPLSAVSERLLRWKFLKVDSFSFAVILCLEIQPEALGHAEVVREAMGNVGGYSSGAAYDVSDTIQRHINITRQPRLAKSQWFEKFVLQNSAGMNCQ
jgi:hypothetical protein